jgi:hypothetical protein
MKYIITYMKYYIQYMHVHMRAHECAIIVNYAHDYIST